MKRWFVIAISLVVFSACSSADDGGGSDGGGDGGSGGMGGTGGIVPVEVDWETCDLVTGQAECAILEMPLDRDDPASTKISFFVRRIKAQGESRGQLWLLEGGPGINGGQLANYADGFLRDLGLDIYMPDYRGAGRSDGLNCGGGEADLKWACLNSLRQKFGEDLVRFSTSDAVRDVGEAIQLFRRPGEEIYVWGTSYGTVAAHRFLHLFPDLANGVVLDSACGAAGCNIPYGDVDVDRNARDVAELCRNDEFCKSKLGSDPWAKVADVLERVEQGHCATGVSSEILPQLRPIFAQLMSTVFMPSVGMALIYRLDRCSEADATAVQNLFSVLTDDGMGWAIQDELERSLPLYYNIVLNEFWDSSLRVEDIEEINRDIVVTHDAVRHFPGISDSWTWPRYEVPADLQVWPDANVPVLILNGTLDAQTRPERMIDARDAFTGPNQHVVIVPYGTHGVFVGSARSSSDPNYTCGSSITRQFLRDPTSALDTSCLEEQMPPRFDRVEYQSFWFGTSDLYENAQSPRPEMVELDDPYLKLQLARARALLQRQQR